MHASRRAAALLVALFALALAAAALVAGPAAAAPSAPPGSLADTYVPGPNGGDGFFFSGCADDVHGGVALFHLSGLASLSSRYPGLVTVDGSVTFASATGPVTALSLRFRIDGRDGTVVVGSASLRPDVPGSVSWRDGACDSQSTAFFEVEAAYFATIVLPDGSAFHDEGLVDVYNVGGPAGISFDQSFLDVLPPTATPDVAPPVFPDMPGVSAQATTPQGGPATYAVTAVDGVDGPVPAVCDVPSGSFLPLGNTIVRCSATDAAGNTARTAFAIVVTIAKFTTAPPAVTSSQDAPVAWSAIVPGRFLCQLDSGPLAPCSSPRTYHGLAAGQHVLCVLESQLDNEAACITWTIVSPGKPVVTITSVVRTATQSIVTFTSDQTAPRFTCSLDGAAYAACSSPRTYNGLARGTHSLRVLATNFAGDTSASPAVASIVVP